MSATEVDNTPSAKQGFDVYLYLVYSCLLVSYININVIVFRFWLIMASIFFIIWALLPKNAVQIDVLVFNSVFILINIIMMIPLVKQVWPVKLTPLEQELFERDFIAHMNKKQFKRFISKFKALKYKDRAQLCANRSQFTHLFYIAKLYPGWKINLKSSSDVSFKNISEGGWIGTIEYVLYENLKAQKMKKKDNSEVIVSWGVTAEIFKESEVNLSQEKSEEMHGMYENEENDNIATPSGALIYKIDIEVKILLIIIYF